MMKSDTTKLFGFCIFFQLKKPSSGITRQCPVGYRMGVLASFIDEQNHAVWLLYFMNQ